MRVNETSADRAARLVHALDTLKQTHEDLKTRKATLLETISAARTEIQMLEPQLKVPLVEIYPRPIDLETQRLQRKLAELTDRLHRDSGRRQKAQSLFEIALSNKHKEHQRIQKYREKEKMAMADLRAVVQIVRELKAKPTYDQIHTDLQQRMAKHENTSESQKRILMNQLTLLRQEYAEDEVRVRQLGVEVGEKIREIGRLEAELERQEIVMEDFDGKIAFVIDQNKDLFADIRQVQNTLDVLRREVNETEFQIRRAAEIESKLAKRLRLRSNQNLAIVAEVKKVGFALLKDRKDLDAQIAADASNVREQSESLITAKNAEIARIRADIETLNSRFQSLADAIQKQEDGRQAEAEQFENASRSYRSRTETMQKMLQAITSSSPT
jgi:chromosome segregation ATPase